MSNDKRSASGQYASVFSLFRRQYVVTPTSSSDLSLIIEYRLTSIRTNPRCPMNEQQLIEAMRLKLT
eukprot:6174479-Pleurochrysis_carterae.AAC.5